MLAHVVVEPASESDGAEDGAEPHPLRPLRAQRRADVIPDVCYDGPDSSALLVGRLGLLLSERCRSDRRRSQRHGSV
jgi:hypothetical protein